MVLEGKSCVEYGPFQQKAEIRKKLVSACKYSIFMSVAYGSVVLNMWHWHLPFCRSLLGGGPPPPMCGFSEIKILPVQWPRECSMWKWTMRQWPFHIPPTGLTLLSEMKPHTVKVMGLSRSSTLIKGWSTLINTGLFYLERYGEGAWRAF